MFVLDKSDHPQPLALCAVHWQTRHHQTFPHEARLDFLSPLNTSGDLAQYLRLLSPSDPQLTQSVSQLYTSPSNYAALSSLPPVHQGHGPIKDNPWHPLLPTKSSTASKGPSRALPPLPSSSSSIMLPLHPCHPQPYTTLRELYRHVSKGTLPTPAH